VDKQAEMAPRWILDLERLLPIRSQFVISGNIRDSFIVRMQERHTLVPLLRCLWEALNRQEYGLMLVYDPIEGVRPYPNEPAVVERAVRLFDLKLQDGAMPVSLESLAGLMKRVTEMRELRCAIVIDFASRLVRQADHLDQAEHHFYVAAERLAASAVPIVPEGAAAAPGAARFNPVVWLLNRPQDMPSWLTLDSPRLATLNIANPDYETRKAAASIVGALFEGWAQADAAARAVFSARFADLTDGMWLSAMGDSAQLARRRGMRYQDVDEAVQGYKVGIVDNPWKKSYMREKIRNGHSAIEDRVKGQPQAITKTLDILMRSVMGLTGAQARSPGNRPRGVLFFAGPTGVGKTELAKALTQLVFGDERAYLRFDMSEFAEEHTGARLLGAPPGYIGYDAGGELTNAVREKPFSVILFDEIEKAHPRILDKFLQILEDGRLTDGRGETAYFSEAVIVFTSNLGIYVENERGQRVQNVQPGDKYEAVEARVRGAIADYFKFKLSRPEILNRIGDNIVVFNFIVPEVAVRILEGMLRNVINRVKEEHHIALGFSRDAQQSLVALCTRDLSNGGRGIGNQVESCFINPLGRALFGMDLAGKTNLTVRRVVEDANRIVSLELE
jgi:ATP-dependent Clp protease ATP-binding subunit ClpB